jgi:hypothetical protein
MTSTGPLPNRLSGASRCIPDSLAELAGPDRGQVSLPVRLAWSGPTSFDVSEVDLLKEAIGQPALMEIGPVLAFDDAVRLKVRALHERAAHRDFIDIRARLAAGETGPECVAATQWDSYLDEPPDVFFD